MPEQWEIDKGQSDKLIVKIKRILGEFQIQEAPEEEDRERNTDLISLELRPIRTQCHVRDYEDYARYGHQFAMRTKRDSGAETEMVKVMKGYGEHFFYAFANEKHTDLHSWGLGDLNVFRLYVVQYMQHHKGRTPGEMFHNNDRTHGVAFNWVDLPDDFLIAGHNLGPN